MALGKTVKQLLMEIDSDELTEWMAFYQFEPFGQQWLQTGTIAAESAKPFVKSGTTVEAKHYLPVVPPEEDQSPEEMLAIFKRMATAKEPRGHL